MAANFNGDFAVAWESDHTGMLNQQVSQATAGRQEQMTVAVSPWAEVAVAYTDDNDNDNFDQVILGLGISNAGW